MILKKISKKLENSFLIGAEKLEESFEKNPKINISFGLSDENAVKYAKEKGSKLISQVDDYTKQRIANLVADGIENNKGYGFVAKQLHEYFSQLNQVYFVDNQIFRVLLPKTYENMKNFYKKYLNLDFKD